MLAFPVANLANVRTSHRGATAPLLYPSALVKLPVMLAQRRLESSFNRAFLSLQSSEFNRQIREVKRRVTYRKYTPAIRSNRQKIQNSTRELSPLLHPSESRRPVHSPRGQT